MSEETWPSMQQFVTNLDEKIKLFEEERKNIPVSPPKTFTLQGWELHQFNLWNETHKCQFNTPTPENPFPSGAIGGRLTFSFTPTGLGTGITVECACGEKKDCTDIEMW